MRWWTGAALLFCVTQAGCSSLRIRGGRSISEEETALIQPLRRFHPARCVDVSGRSTRTLPPETLFLASADHGRQVLLITFAGRESWVLEEMGHVGDERVFQLSLEGGNSGSLLRDVRLTDRGGRLAYVRRWWEERSPEFVRAYFDQAELSCELALSTAAEP